MNTISTIFLSLILMTAQQAYAEGVPKCGTILSAKGAHELREILNWIKSKKTEYTDLTVKGRMVVYGLPPNARELRPDEISNKVFRHYLPTDAALIVKESSELRAGNTPFVQGEFVFADLTGVFLTTPESIDQSVGVSQNHWVDVKISPDLPVLKLPGDIYLIPGNPPSPQWLMEKIKAGSKAKEFGRTGERILISGGRPTVLPVEILASSVVNSNPELQVNSLFKSYISDPNLSDLFKADAGVREGYTIQQHTRRVLDLLESEWPNYRSDLVGPELGPEFITHLVVLHDIGKPLAIRARTPEKQHEFTLSILRQQLKERGFNQRTIQLAEGIVGQDIIGKVVQKELTPSRAKKMIAELAANNQLPIHQIFKFLSFFYTIDAASYPGLRSEHFKEEDGRLVVQGKAFQTLKNLIEKQ